MTRLAVLLLFFLSGAAGLVYQIVWMRQLTLVLGVTSEAVGTVLAVFMGGLALGSWAIGRVADRARSPLRLYGWLELGIAASALATLPLLQSLPALVAPWKHATGGLFPLLRVAIAAAVLLVPTALMGATLPLLLRAVCRTRERIARESGLLYGVNTLGAVAGTLASAFLLVAALGLRGTAYTAAATNAVVGVAALLLARRAAPLDHSSTDRAPSDRAPTDRASADRAPADAATPDDRRTARVVVLAFGASGAFALAYEVLWTRYLVYVLGENSVYAFASMLASFLLGIALGSLLASWLADRVENRVALLGGSMVLLGAAAATTVTLMGVVARDESARYTTDPFWIVTARQLLASLAILAVPATLSGCTLAIVARILARDVASIGRVVGRAYATNTLGAILGALAGAFVLLPRLGLVHGLLALAGANALTGLGLLLWRGPRGRAPWTALATGAVAAGALAAAFFLAASPRELLERRTHDRILYSADGPESSIAVGEAVGGMRSLFVDGEEQAGTDVDGQIHLRLLGHLPALFHPDPKDGLVVAFGAGVTTGCLLQHDLERVDVVELNPRVIREASAFFEDANHDPVHDPRFHAIFDDGRSYLLSTDRTYDVITSDPIDPNDAGTTSLYSREYYELVRSRLREGGVACQWITNGYGSEAYRAMLRAFQLAFPNASIWYGSGTTVVVGYRDAPRVTMADLRRKLARPRVRASLDFVGIDSAETLLAMLLVGPERLRAALWDDDPSTEERVNSDDRPFLEYVRPGPTRDDPDEWALLLGGRTPNRGDWVAGWTPEDERAASFAYDAMTTLLGPHGLPAAMPAPVGSDARLLEHARARETRNRAELDAVWDLLGRDVPRVYLVMTGIDHAEPYGVTDEAVLRRYDEGMAAGFEAFAAGELATAVDAFDLVLLAFPNSVRARLLVAACEERGGDPVGALRTLLAGASEADFGELAYWTFDARMARKIGLAAISAMEEGDARAIGEGLARLLPADEERPAKRPTDPWSRDAARRVWPPRPRPSGDAVADPDAWRLWWSEAHDALRIRPGRFAWR